MQTVGIRQLRNRLSEYVRAAASGQTVRVTDRGRVVAELVPPPAQAQGSPAEQRLAELSRLGLLQPAPAARRARLPARRPVASIGAVLRELDASRGER